MNSMKIRIEEVNNGLLLTMAEAKDDKVLGRYVFHTDEQMLEYLVAVLAARRNNAENRS